MTVVIAGGGVAGLTVARTLHRAGLSFLLVDPQMRRGDRGLGLWGRAQAALFALGLDQLLADNNRSHYIPAAAYRSKSGEWLSRCSSNDFNLFRVCTLRESDLLFALQQGLPQVQLELGVEVTEVKPHSDNTLSVQLSNGRQVDATALIAADGANSFARRALFPSHLIDVHDTGYVSCGGILGPPSSSGEMELNEPLAFETLSAGSRFALVPLASGSTYWFATCSRAVLERNGLALPRPSAHANHTGAAEPVAILDTLKHVFHGWHAPIQYALQRAAASPAAETSPLRVDTILDVRAPRKWHEGRAVLVGDAAHALPINLAQGAAMSIEGSYLLGRELAKLDPPTASLARLQDAFTGYQASHEARVAQCRTATSFTRMLASPASSVTESVRNAMRMVPQVSLRKGMPRASTQ